MAIDFGSNRPAARKPGQYGRKILRRNALRWVIALFFFTALPLLAFGLGIHKRLAIPLVLVLELLAIGVMLAGDRKVTPGLERRLQGVEGEEKVGAILDGLAADGWFAIHDVATGRGNIDHIAIGPAGVFTIETKSRRGRVSIPSLNEAWLRQAYAESKSLEELVGVKANPLLVLSDAYLVERPVAFERGVTILPARMLVGHLEKRKQILTHTQVEDSYARVASALGSQ